LEMCAIEEASELTEVYRGSKTECTVGNLLPGTTYRFQVRAANSVGVSHPVHKHMTKLLKFKMIHNINKYFNSL